MGRSDSDITVASLADLIASAQEFTNTDDDERWQLLRELHRRGDEPTFRALHTLAQSTSPHERVLAADGLSQFGYATPDDPLVASLRRRAAISLVSLSGDADVDVVYSAVHGLGHLGDPVGLDAVLRHVENPEACVREAVAAALPSVSGWGDPLLEQVSETDGARLVAALVVLADDSCDEVRDWALFGLGNQLEVDGPEIRAALVRHLADPYEEARDEAVVGLARRGDQRALPVILSELKSESVSSLIIEAAACLGDPSCLPGLLQLDGPESDHDPLVDALRNCDPAQCRHMTDSGATLEDALRGALLEVAAGDVDVVAGREPFESGWRLQAAWSSEGQPVRLYYDLVGLIARLEDAAPAIAFARDIAEAEAR